jgi:hypothetical protein
MLRAIMLYTSRMTGNKAVFNQQPQVNHAYRVLGTPGERHVACHWHWAGLLLTTCGFMAA